MLVYDTCMMCSFESLEVSDVLDAHSRCEFPREKAMHSEIQSGSCKFGFWKKADRLQIGVRDERGWVREQ